MPVFQLTEALLFPSPELAEPDGLLAIGGDLSPARLIMAYANGIFPWYTEEDPILWWSPAPRLVLYPNEFHLPRRLARKIRKNVFSVTADTAFDQVIGACSTAGGRGEQGTWITPEIHQAYVQLHELGYAHSIEAWEGETLAGGLYGVCLDGVFFGESMFTHITDGSKIALAHLIKAAPRLGIRLIDCQMTTSHLVGFGAREVDRETFLKELEKYITDCTPQKKWRLLSR